MGNDEEIGADEQLEDVVDESQADDQGLYEIGESSLTYFGADFDVRGLVRRLEEEDIFVPRFDPDESAGSKLDGFQRQRVWSKPRMESFIESLLLGWPVPSIFMVLDEDQRYLVLDGQQRLTALSSFYAGLYPDGKEFKLADVAKHLVGATHATLSSESRRRLDNTFIQATVIEPKGDSGRESVYRLFGRLNSGGVSLTAQEIRVALYRGPIVDFIRDLNHDSNWRELFGAKSQRLKDHELILRALALGDLTTAAHGRWTAAAKDKKLYRPPLAEFLNAYLQRHRNLEGIETAKITAAFSSSTDALWKAGGKDAIRFDGRLNAAHVDAVLATLMWLQQNGKLPSQTALARNLTELRRSTKYAGFVTQSTSHVDSVFGRLQEALRILSKK